ncbi:MAG: ATP-binding protein, partial [Acidimicrobiia bacterium]
MTRATATVLFTDLVGSTELRGRLGEEAAEDLRRKHDELLARAVEGHGGRVVKGLGDGIMAAFSGAADAVAAAVAIQQAVDRFNRSGKAPVPLAVRVGLSAGDVTFEDDDVHGTPVVEASRLCGAAVGGEILASEIVRWLGGAQGAPSFIPVGSLELKGLATPVPTVRVEWEPVRASTIPMPALLTDVGRIFVGRDAELERLQQLWKEATAGERRVALLAGEPGVGKTRLAAEVAIRVNDRGGAVLAGRCDEDLGVPYQPFVEALRHFVDHTPSQALEERLGRYGGELARLVPELSERVADLPAPLRSDPETERYRLFDAVAAWLTAAAAEEPLVLVLDDLQWAAKPTLLLLRHIVRTSDVGRLLILGTYRDTELTHDHPLVELLADLRRDGTIERLPLSGLDDAGVAAFVEQAAGQALDEDGLALARAIYQETEGNPFFVREVLRHLAETNV